MSGMMLNFVGVFAATTPGAPTIGTATATGSTTATVSFTAPANNGGATITSYTAVSSPSGITGTLSQAGSGTITVSGLAPLTAYTFVVFATNSAGNSPNSASSNSITTLVPSIGQAFGGGFYAGQISTTANSVATDYLVVAPKSSGESGNLLWQNPRTFTGATSNINGPSNTAILAALGTAPPATFCNDLVIGSFSDWYMPAKNEMEVCYFNLKPSTTSNDTSTGANPNAVPARASNYTSGNPARTSAANFQAGGAEQWNESPYWNSTQYDQLNAWRQYFSFGLQNYVGKFGYVRTRAVRRIAV